MSPIDLPVFAADDPSAATVEAFFSVESGTELELEISMSQSAANNFTSDDPNGNNESIVFDVLFDEIPISMEIVDPFYAIAAPSFPTFPFAVRDNTCGVVQPAFRYQFSPQLFLTGGLPASASALHQQLGIARTVTGAVADGATRVLVIANVPAAGFVGFNIEDENGAPLSGGGYLQSIGAGQTSTSISVPTVGLPEAQYAYAWYFPPEDLTEIPSSSNAPSRTVTVRSNFVSQSGVQAETEMDFEIHRPPVLLAHGFNSGPETWCGAVPGSDSWGLLADSRFRVFLADYGSTSTAAFSLNGNVVRSRISKVLDALRIERIAATQVDFVGHSMGGLLARRYLANPLAFGNENFGDGPIHKLITLATPHFGAPLGDVGTSLINHPIVGSAFSDFMAAAGLCVSCGAVEDLAIANMQLEAIQAQDREFAVHSLVALGGDDLIGLIDQGTSLPSSTLRDSVPLRIPFVYLSMLTLNTLTNVYNSSFAGEEHDLLVGESSQVGGLQPSQATSYPWISVFNARNHLTVTKDPAIGDRVVDLLNRGITESVFASGYPAVGSGQSPVDLSSVNLQSTPVSGLSLTELPPSGGSGSGGPSILVNGTNGFVPSRVMLATPNGVELQTEAPFEFEIDVEGEWPDGFSAHAIGIDTSGQTTVGEEIVIVPEPAFGLGLGIALLVGCFARNRIWDSRQRVA